MGRQKHPQYPYARWLYMEQTDDLDQIASLTGVAPKTLEKWRAGEEWIEQKAQTRQQRAAAAPPVQTMDDVIQIFVGILLQKAEEIRDTPIEEIDPGALDGLHKLVKSIREMGGELKLLSQKQMLLTAMDQVRHATDQHERGHLEHAKMLDIHDFLSDYCDHKLQE